MAVTRLSNERWGFESNCFVCEPRNDTGLRIPFFHDDDTDVVTAELELTDAFSGAPRYVHGGIILAVLDEAMAWATIAIAGSFAVTKTTTTTFTHPVKIGRRYRVEARVTGRETSEITTEGTVLDEKGRLCASAHATFAHLTEAQAVDAVGSIDEGSAGFVR